jgi:Arc/MetJ-type ribon-helix-helix transcriptional regulator
MGKPTNNTSVNLGTDLERLRRVCAERGLNQSDVIRAGVRSAINHIQSGGSLEDLSLPSHIGARLTSIEAAVARASRPARAEEIAERLEAIQRIIDEIQGIIG